MKKRIIFMGTPSFAATILEKLAETKNDLFEVVAVISQPDKKVGRKRVLQPTPVKVVAALHNLPVLQPEKIGAAYDEIAAFHPDLIVTAAYGQLVPEKILELPTFGCINIHGSLLPKYRGGSPVHRAIVDGEDKTGITIMYMAKKLDAGDMLVKREVTIEHEDTLESMFGKLEVAGYELLLEMLPDFFGGKIKAVPQVETEATFAANIQREETKIVWDMSAFSIYNHVRGFSPAPATFSTLNGVDIKIYKATIVEGMTDAAPGTIVKADNKACHVATGDGILALEDIQISGKKRQLIHEVMNGAGRNMIVEGEHFE